MCTIIGRCSCAARARSGSSRARTVVTRRSRRSATRSPTPSRTGSLGHKNLQTTIRFYVGLETAQASERFGEIVHAHLAPAASRGSRDGDLPQALGLAFGRPTGLGRGLPTQAGSEEGRRCRPSGTHHDDGPRAPLRILPDLLKERGALDPSAEAAAQTT